MKDRLLGVALGAILWGLFPPAPLCSFGLPGEVEVSRLGTGKE